MHELIYENPNTSFFIIGILTNISLMFVMAFIDSIKLSSMDEKQNDLVKDFIGVRHSVIVDSNSLLKRSLATCQLLLPFYSIHLSIIRLYYLMKYNGSFAIIAGIVAYDKYSVLNLITYSFDEEY